MSWKTEKEKAAKQHPAPEAPAPKEVLPPPEAWVVKVEMDGSHQAHGTLFGSKQMAEAFARTVFTEGFTVETPSATHIYPPSRIGSVTVEKKP
jgi:hypothetical protein